MISKFFLLILLLSPSFCLAGNDGGGSGFVQISQFTASNSNNLEIKFIGLTNDGVVFKVKSEDSEKIFTVPEEELEERSSQLLDAIEDSFNSEQSEADWVEI